MQWDPTKKFSTSTSTNKGGIHSKDNSIAAKVKIAALLKRIKVFETPSAPQLSQVNQIQTPTHFNSGTINHIMEEYNINLLPYSVYSDREGLAGFIQWTVSTYYLIQCTVSTCYLVQFTNSQIWASRDLQRLHYSQPRDL